MKLWRLLGLAIFLLISTGCDVAPKVEYEFKTVQGEVVTMKCPYVERGNGGFVFNYCYVVD